ncbi:MAG: tetratricopeptide repeat protein [Acidobacteria bacterium]|nr:tetratricopeptide repeat protein [Acidobacteriota bacterium]MCG3194574.1 hypothetical protein [Thermoanaerobaculia bacterium]
MTDARTVAELLTDAREAIRDGDFPLGRKLLESAREKGASSEDVHADLAECCLKTKDYEGAREAASKGVERFPEGIACRQVRARSNLGLLDLDAASRDASFVLAKEPRSTRALMTMAHVELARNNPARARDYAAEARRLDPESAEATLALAASAKLEGKRGQAERLTIEAAEMAPLEPGIWASLSGIALENEDAEMALVCSALAIVLSDEPPPGMVLVRASALERLGRLDEAEAAYAQCAAAPPHSAWAWVSLARLESRNESRAALAVSHARIAAGLARHQRDAKAQAAAEALLSRLASGAFGGG